MGKPRTSLEAPRRWGAAGALLGAGLSAALAAPGLAGAAEAAPPPASAPGLPAPGLPASPGAAAAPEADQNQRPQDPTLVRVGDKPWQLTADAQFRSLLITDEDPANDRYLLYRLQAAYYPLPWLGLVARAGLLQRFVSVEGESGLRMEDTVLGAVATHSVSLAPWGWERSVGLVHGLRVLLPTSFQSDQQDLYFAADGFTRARVELWERVYAGVRGRLHYRANQYAEQAGPGGEALPRFLMEGLVFAEYSPLVSKKWGTLTLGADAYADETLYYPSPGGGSIGPGELPPGTLQAGDVGGLGSGSEVRPHYGYDVYLLYSPVNHLTMSLSLEQTGNVIRYGEPRLYFIHRDQTEIALRFIATY